MKKLLELREKLGRDEPVTASKIDISPKYQNDQYWVCLKMRARSPLVGFIKRKDGELTSVTIAVDTERRRKIRLMVNDCLSISEINDALENPLTKAEIREHIEKGRRI